MDGKKTGSSYEQLYSELLEYAVSIHARNKRRIKIGSIMLLIMPLVLFFIRWITDSDKVGFLLLGVAGLLALACYLIGVEYLDVSIQKKLRELTDREADFDSLLEKGPFAEQFNKRVEELRRFGIEGLTDEDARDEDPKEDEASDNTEKDGDGK